MFVAVDRTHAVRSLTHSPRPRADALARCERGPLGLDSDVLENTGVWTLKENNPNSDSVCHAPIRKTPQNRPFGGRWKRRQYITLFAKIRQECISLNVHQSPLNRGSFCHLVYPIRTPKRLPECEYEGRFFRGSEKKSNFQR